MNIDVFQKDLLTWYQENKRELPFRKSKDAYQIWISEIMAQQTRIEAMLPYFERFIQELPDIHALANASDEKLHKLWQGLGYYSRARNLKKCAQVCMEQYKGSLPQTKKELVSLPGIGPYTAGAIASIAFGEVASAVDGNVIRVFSRLFDHHGDMTKVKYKKEIEQKVNETLPSSKWISSFNQALMELGALVCIPKNPRCQCCPVSSHCQAKDPSNLPVMIKKVKRRIEKKTMYCLVCQDKVHLVQREDKGLLAGLYGFDEMCPTTYIERIPLKPYVHIFSHVEWHMNGYIVFTENRDNHYYSLNRINQEFAIPSAFQTFLKQVERIIYERSCY